MAAAEKVRGAHSPTDARCFALDVRRDRARTRPTVFSAEPDGAASDGISPAQNHTFTEKRLSANASERGRTGRTSWCTSLGKKTAVLSAGTTLTWRWPLCACPFRMTVS